jgi:hypothetical protein
MSEPMDGALPPPPELPPELQAALERALSQSLGSLDSLRITIRRHVRSQRKRGASLDEIDAQMRKMMAAADTKADDGATVTRELSTQIAKWTRTFFSGTPS